MTLWPAFEFKTHHRIWLNNAKCRKHFTKIFTGNESNSNWLEQELAAPASYAQAMAAEKDEILRRIENIKAVELEASIKIPKLKTSIGACPLAKPKLAARKK